MKNKTNKSVKHNRRSQKGKWGKVGAPPKKTTFPKGAFTMETLFGRNSNQCELSLRNKVDVLLASGALIALKTRKQKGGAVGRPKAVFVLKENFDAAKHEKADKTVKTPRVKRTPVAVTPAVPATAPVGIVVTEPPMATPVAAISTPEPVSSPEPTAPVTAEATVVTEASAPAPVEPQIG